MIIVSQDRKVVINFNTLELLVIKEKYDFRTEGFSIVCNQARMTSVLATYKTEERAKEVLKLLA